MATLPLPWSVPPRHPVEFPLSQLNHTISCADRTVCPKKAGTSCGPPYLQHEIQCQ